MGKRLGTSVAMATLTSGPSSLRPASTLPAGSLIPFACACLFSYKNHREELEKDTQNLPISDPSLALPLSRGQEEYGPTWR